MGLDRDGGGGAIVRAGALYFLIVFAAGFLFGLLRVLLVVPRLGTRTAELIELPLMLVVIGLAARWLVRRYPRFSTSRRLAAGALALGLLAAAELILAWQLSGLGPLAYIASRDPVSGTAYAVCLLVFALAPAALRRLD